MKNGLLLLQTITSETINNCCTSEPKHLRSLLDGVSIDEVSHKGRKKRCIDCFFFEAPWNPWLTAVLAMMHLQFKYWKRYLGRNTLWYRIMQNGSWVLQPGMKRSGRMVTLHPEFGADGANPSPHSMCTSFCAAHVWQTADFVSALTSLKDGCWDVLGHERDVQRWAGRQMMSWEQPGKGSGSKGAPDTLTGAGVHCQALCKPSREIGLKGSFPLGKIRCRRRRCTIPPCSFSGRNYFSLQSLLKY